MDLKVDIKQLKGKKIAVDGLLKLVLLELMDTTII